MTQNDDSDSVVKERFKTPEDLVKVTFTRSPGDGGADRARTDDLRLAKAALSQLSYCPSGFQLKPVVGLGGFEPPASRLSGVRSNQLSYRPFKRTKTRLVENWIDRD